MIQKGGLIQRFKLSKNSERFSSFRLPRGASDVCGICFDDGFTEMVLYESSTLNGPCHSFCIDCFKRHAEISVKVGIPGP